MPEARSNEPIAPEQYFIHARKRVIIEPSSPVSATLRGLIGKRFGGRLPGSMHLRKQSISGSDGGESPANKSRFGSHSKF